MMTKKDYVRAAEICKDDYDSDANVVRAFVDFFTGDNPRFDVERFVEACMPEASRTTRRR
jgi:hypothetical protein